MLQRLGAEWQRTVVYNTFWIGFEQPLGRVLTFRLDELSITFGKNRRPVFQVVRVGSKEIHEVLAEPLFGELLGFATETARKRFGRDLAQAAARDPAIQKLRPAAEDGVALGMGQNWDKARAFDFVKDPVHLLRNKLIAKFDQNVIALIDGK